MQAGLSSDTLELDVRLIPLVAGRQGGELERVMHATRTNIYMPQVPLDTQASVEWDSDKRFSAVIRITGQSKDVAEAKTRLKVLSSEVKGQTKTKQIICLAKKLDWLHTHQRDALRKIMHDNATLLILPPVGSSTNVLIVLGTDSVYIERSVRAVMILICDFYTACLRRYSPPTPDLNAQIIKDMLDISRETGAEITLFPQYLEICGLKSLVVDAYKLMIATDYFSVCFI